MIISHEKKFIFIKTEKTAGTSIEIALSKYCGPCDTITSVSPKDEELRAALGHRGPQHDQVPMRMWTLRDWRRACLRLRWPTFHSHSGASRIEPFVSPEQWETYFKFCFERNPWDKIVSWYHWTYRHAPQKPTLDEFVMSGRFADVKGRDLYKLRDRIAVDKIYRFEDMPAAMEDIAERLNLPEVPVLPRTKVSNKEKKGTYRDMLSNG